MKIKAPAKLNLSLNILPQKRKNGLYTVKFLNCQLALADEIEIRPSKKTEVISSHPQLGKEEDNLVYRAIQLLPKKRGVRIILKKIIPVKSGLGGGSSDAAAALHCLNKAWNLKLSTERLLEIGKNLGMDVVYCLVGGLCLVGGAGEKVKRLNLSLPRLPLVIITPLDRKPSSAWAYQNLDRKKIGKNRKKIKKLLEAIKKRKIKEITNNLHNDFEYSINKQFPIVQRIKSDLNNHGALQAMLCGSGLSVFGMFEKKSIAQEAFHQLKKKHQIIFLTST